MHLLEQFLQLVVVRLQRLGVRLGVVKVYQLRFFSARDARSEQVMGDQHRTLKRGYGWVLSHAAAV